MIVNGQKPSKLLKKVLFLLKKFHVNLLMTNRSKTKCSYFEEIKKKKQIEKQFIP